MSASACCGQAESDGYVGGGVQVVAGGPLCRMIDPSKRERAAPMRRFLRSVSAEIGP